MKPMKTENTKNVFTGIKTALETANRPIENFFKRRAEEATIPKAALVFLSYLFLYSIFVLTLMNGQVKLENGIILSDVMKMDIYDEVLVRALFMLGIWGSASVLFKKEVKFTSVLYCFSIVSFLAAGVQLLLILSGIIPQTFIGIANWAVIAVMTYVYITIIRSLTGLSLLKSIFLLAAAEIFALVMAVIAWAYLWISITPSWSPEHAEFKFNTTNNSDGTLTATYIRSYNESGRVEQCDVTFPAGWISENANDTELAYIRGKLFGFNTLHPYSAFCKYENFKRRACFVFEYAPPLTIGDPLVESANELTKENSKNETVKVIYSKNNLAETLDVIKPGISHEFPILHELTVRTTLRLGYTADYLTKKQPDSDLDFILNNSVCTITGGK